MFELDIIEIFDKNETGDSMGLDRGCTVDKLEGDGGQPPLKHGKTRHGTP